MKKRYQLLLVGIVILVCIFFGVMLEIRRQIPMKAYTHHLSVPLPNNRLHFIAFGDQGSGNDDQRRVAALVEALCRGNKPDFLLLLGDNFYPHGVSSLDDPQWQEKVFNMYGGPCMKDVKIYAALGNHDYEGKPLAQIEMTEKNSRWTMPARYYNVSFGNLLDLFVIDTNFPDACWMPFCSLTWTQTQMQKSNAIWKIVAGHHPLISAGRYPRAKAFLAKTLPGVLCKGGADFFLTGHDHGMQHVKGKLLGSSCDIEQFVSAGGGGDLYEVHPIANKTEFARSAFGVLSVDMMPTETSFHFVDADSGQTVYSYTEHVGATQ